MSEFSPQQLDAFARGRLEDEDMEAAMLRHLEASPEGDVAIHLQRLEERARRILDADDSLYVRWMVDVPTTTPSINGGETRGELIVLPSPDPPAKNLSLIQRSAQVPARIWSSIRRNPGRSTMAAACALMLAMGGYRLGDQWHRDDVAQRIAEVDGRQLNVTGDQVNVSVFVECDPSQPLFARLDREGAKPTAWTRVPEGRVLPDAGQRTQPFEGISIHWPRGRTGCIVEVDPAVEGMLYLHQPQSHDFEGGWAAISLPLSRNSDLFEVAKAPPPDLLDAPFSQETAETARAAWASFLHVDQESTNSIGQQFVLIPPGAFTMGSLVPQPDSQPDETEHRVEITQAYYAGRHEVTQGDFEAIMGYNPSHFRQAPDGDPDRLPVENLMWFEMIEFCNRLSQREKVATFYDIEVTERVDGRAKSATVRVLGGNGYRLPTEAEWEYMCRAGTTTRFYTGDSESGVLAEHAHVRFGDEPVTPHPVGSLKPNRFGLYDIHGNIFEWVFDWYDEAYYRKSPRRNPTGSTAGYSRVIRGGSFKDPPKNARAANRGRSQPDYPDIDRGFRIVRSVGSSR